MIDFFESYSQAKIAYSQIVNKTFSVCGQNIRPNSTKNREFFLAKSNASDTSNLAKFVDNFSESASTLRQMATLIFPIMFLHNVMSFISIGWRQMDTLVKLVILHQNVQWPRRWSQTSNTILHQSRTQTWRSVLSRRIKSDFNLWQNLLSFSTSKE